MNLVLSLSTLLGLSHLLFCLSLHLLAGQNEKDLLALQDLQQLLLCCKHHSYSQTILVCDQSHLQVFLSFADLQQYRKRNLLAVLCFTDLSTMRRRAVRSFRIDVYNHEFITLFVHNNRHLYFARLFYMNVRSYN